MHSSEILRNSEELGRTLKNSEEHRVWGQTFIVAEFSCRIDTYTTESENLFFTISYLLFSATPQRTSSSHLLHKFLPACGMSGRTTHTLQGCHRICTSMYSYAYTWQNTTVFTYKYVLSLPLAIHLSVWGSLFQVVGKISSVPPPPHPYPCLTAPPQSCFFIPLSYANKFL